MIAFFGITIDLITLVITAFTVHVISTVIVVFIIIAVVIVIREFKKTTTATATGTSLNKRFNEQNNGYAYAS